MCMDKRGKNRLANKQIHRTPRERLGFMSSVMHAAGSGIRIVMPYLAVVPSDRGCMLLSPQFCKRRAVQMNRPNPCQARAVKSRCNAGRSPYTLA